MKLRPYKTTVVHAILLRQILCNWIVWFVQPVPDFMRPDVLTQQGNFQNSRH